MNEKKTRVPPKWFVVTEQGSIRMCSTKKEAAKVIAQEGSKIIVRGHEHLPIIENVTRVSF